MPKELLYGFETDIIINDTDKSNLEWTPEGYLDCKNAVFAHIGPRKYHVKELGITDADSDYVFVYRTEDDLFSKQNLNSIKGKSITDRHPSQMVSSKNWKNHEVGVAYDSFRDGDFLKGNLLIKDEKKAKDVYEGKIRALSLGYKAKVVKDEEGKYKFVNSINNHIALVAKGRDSEAFIMDSADILVGEGGEKTLEQQTQTTEPNEINDAIIKNESEVHTVRNSSYDTETDEEVETVVETRTHRRKVEKDEINQEVNSDIKDEKIKENEKEISKSMKTLKELMTEYKEVHDTFPDSEAKDAELKRINDEALELHKVSLEPKKVEVADSPLKNIKAVEKTITDNATTKETKIGVELDDADRDLYLQDFYSKLNPMSNIHDSFEKGMEYFDKVSRADISTLRREVRKAGN